MCRTHEVRRRKASQRMMANWPTDLPDAVARRAGEVSVKRTAGGQIFVDLTE
jgi:hypothetical protein